MKKHWRPCSKQRVLRLAQPPRACSQECTSEFRNQRRRGPRKGQQLDSAGQEMLKSSRHERAVSTESYILGPEDEMIVQDKGEGDKDHQNVHFKIEFEVDDVSHNDEV